MSSLSRNSCAKAFGNWSRGKSFRLKKLRGGRVRRTTNHSHFGSTTLTLTQTLTLTLTLQRTPPPASLRVKRIRALVEKSRLMPVLWSVSWSGRHLAWDLESRSCPNPLGNKSKIKLLKCLKFAKKSFLFSKRLKFCLKKIIVSNCQHLEIVSITGVWRQAAIATTVFLYFYQQSTYNALCV